MNNSIRVMCEPLRTVNNLVIHNAGAGVYVSIDAVSPAISHPARMILLQNLTNASLMISDDGVNAKWPISANTSMILDLTSNASTLNGGWYYPEGTRFYVAQIEDPTDGDLYLTVFYGSEI